MTTETTTFKYGTFEIDRSKLPATSDEAMFRRGLSHYLGSEQASKVTGMFKPDAEGKIKAEVADTAENRAEMLAAFQAKAIDALLAGTVGVSTRGPTIDPVSKHVQRLAKAEVFNILTKNGVKTPKKAEDVITTPDGGKYTMEQLVSRRLAHAEHGPRLQKEGERAHADAVKKAAKLEAAAVAEGLSCL